MKNFVWLSFDLGVNGDYEGMYIWLDRHKAKECGDSIACFWYEYSGDLLRSIKKDLGTNVKLNGKSRIYVIRLDLDKNIMRGKFIFGSRRSPPWAGLAGTGEVAEDSNA